MIEIRNKQANYGEIIVYLFEQCHLTCVFCHQDHNGIEGQSHKAIMDKIKTIVDWINSNSSVNVFNIHLMGGEVFQDHLIEEGFLDTYKEMVNRIRLGVDLSKEVNILFSTSLVLDNIQTLKEFLKETDTRLNISYDPKGRFNKNNLRVFKDNVEIVNDYIEVVSSVMTEGSMKSIIKGDDYYNYLYSKYTCVWDTLLPVNDKSKALMPADSLTLDFYKTCVDLYPNSPTFEYFVSDNIYNKMSCTRGRQLTINPDGKPITSCPAHDFPEIEITTTASIDSPVLVENFISDNECMTCDYFKMCPLTCYVKNDSIHTLHDVDGCVYKHIFEYNKYKYTI